MLQRLGMKRTRDRLQLRSNEVQGGGRRNSVGGRSVKAAPGEKRGRDFDSSVRGGRRGTLEENQRRKSLGGGVKS